jgi:hypothetical protein
MAAARTRAARPGRRRAARGRPRGRRPAGCSPPARRGTGRIPTGVRRSGAAEAAPPGGGPPPGGRGARSPAWQYPRPSNHPCCSGRHWMVVQQSIKRRASECKARAGVQEGRAADRFGHGPGPRGPDAQGLFRTARGGERCDGLPSSAPNRRLRCRPSFSTLSGSGRFLTSAAKRLPRLRSLCPLQGAPQDGAALEKAPPPARSPGRGPSSTPSFP